MFIRKPEVVASELDVPLPETQTTSSWAAAAPGLPGPPKSTPNKAETKALPTVRDHTTDQLGPEGDEYIPRKYDEAGEKKVTATGQLLDGREYRCRTFFVPDRGDKLFMLATECARVLGYRDSYLMFNKNRSLYKIIATQVEKEDLVHQEILPFSYRSRQIAIVTARSMYRQFGSRVIVNGRHVRDDYWETESRKQGFTEEDMAEEKRPDAAKARDAAAEEANANASMALGHEQSSTIGQAANPYGFTPQTQMWPPSHPQQSPQHLPSFTYGPHLQQPVQQSTHQPPPRLRQSGLSSQTQPPLRYPGQQGMGRLPLGQGDSARCAPLPMITVAPEQPDMRLRDYSSIQRPRQEITGPAYQDRTQTSPPSELLSHAHQPVEYNKQVKYQRHLDSEALDSRWRTPQTTPAIRTKVTERTALKSRASGGNEKGVEGAERGFLGGRRPSRGHQPPSKVENTSEGSNKRRNVDIEETEEDCNVSRDSWLNSYPAGSSINSQSHFDSANSSSETKGIKVGQVHRVSRFVSPQMDT